MKQGPMKVKPIGDATIPPMRMEVVGRYESCEAGYAFQH